MVDYIPVDNSTTNNISGHFVLKYKNLELDETFFLVLENISSDFKLLYFGTDGVLIWNSLVDKCI